MAQKREDWRRNTEGLRANAREKSAATRRRAEEAIDLLVSRGQPVTFKRVAETAGCSTAWLYGQDDLKERISNLRSRRIPKPKVGLPACERASDASRDAVIAALRKANRDLREENAALKRQLEVAYGELAARG